MDGSTIFVMTALNHCRQLFLYQLLQFFCRQPELRTVESPTTRDFPFSALTMTIRVIGWSPLRAVIIRLSKIASDNQANIVSVRGNVLTTHISLVLSAHGLSLISGPKKSCKVKSYSSVT